MIREIQLDNIIFPIKVQHAHLATEERVDSKSSRIDTLLLTLNIQYEHKFIKEKSFEHCFSWSSIYDYITNFEVPTITTPLEFILENILDFIENEAVKQTIKLYNISLKAKRIGLIAGHIELISQRCIHPISKTVKQHFRSAGVSQVPLNVHIDRSWISNQHSIDEEKHLFETFNVSFQLNITSEKISETNLQGLFNYATAYDIIQNKQGFVLQSTIEFLLDYLKDIIIESAKRQSVTPLSGCIIISRNNYPRITPTFILHF